MQIFPVHCRYGEANEEITEREARLKCPAGCHQEHVAEDPQD
ncbi:MAG: hypothetical protein R2806_20425 [Saprospiraceae bacterium]